MLRKKGGPLTLLDKPFQYKITKDLKKIKQTFNVSITTVTVMVIPITSL